ncbi:MAG: OmpA family protein [Bacteroidota bacterium]
MKKALLLIMLGIFSAAVFAQEEGNEPEKDKKLKPNSWAVSLNGGSSQYYGDIATNVYFYPWFPEGGELSYSVFGTVEKHFSPYYGLRLRAGYASYTSRRETGMSLETNLWDIYLENKFSLTSLLFPEEYRKKWSSYALLGYGGPFFRTKLYNKQDSLVGTMGYSADGNTKETRETAGGISLGLGFRVKLSQHLALSAEAGIENLNTDLLDAEKHALSELDKYGHTTIGLVYTFGDNDRQVPYEYNPEPAEDLEVQDKLDSLGQALKELNNKVDGVDEKVDQLAERWEGPDSDNDGISDSYDKEPNTKPGAIVNHRGETVAACCDTIDEIIAKSKGPDVATGNTANSGIAYESVYFALNSTYITPENMKRLAEVAHIMQKNKDVKFKIVGAACKISSDSYNKNLSKRRAEAVQKVLVDNFKIDRSRLVIEFVGEENPVAEEPLYINRRADLYMIK